MVCVGQNNWPLAVNPSVVVDGRNWLLLSIMQRSAPPLSFPSGTKSEPVSCVALSTCKAESASLLLFNRAIVHN